MSDQVQQYVDSVYRDQWRTLLSLERLVQAVLLTLEETNMLNNTFVIFVSDNGYHHGEFRLPLDKRQPYESDIRVPLVVMGPGVTPGIFLSSPTFFSFVILTCYLYRDSEGACT
jgi:N-acetylglucosamine-6-sulfatase